MKLWDPTPEQRVATRLVLRWGGAAVGAMVLASVAAALLTPAGAEVPLHRGLSGEVTRTGSPTILFLMMPVIGLLLLGVLAATVSSGDMWEDGPRRQHQDLRPRAIVASGCLWLLAVIHFVIIAEPAGITDDPLPLLLAVLVVGMAVVGAALVGDRTGEAAMASMMNMPRPTSQEARRRLRRTTGAAWLAVAAGAAVAGWAWSVAVGMAVLLIGLVASCIWSAALSLRLRHQEH